MRLSYQYRIKPTTEQKLKLNHIRRLSQYLYNKMLGERLSWWASNRCYVNACPLVDYVDSCPLVDFEPLTLRDNPTYYDQKRLLPLLKQDLILVEWSGELLDLSEPYSQVMQDVVKRVDLAMQRYIKGDKDGKRSGKPRFKSEATYKSFTYTQVLPNWLKGKYINLTKIGNVEIILHRTIPEGFTVKTCIVSKKADGWYITLTLEDKRVPELTPDEIVANWENSTGLDAVLHENTFLATSNGDLITARKAYRTNQAKLQKVSSKKSSKRKGSRSRRKLAKQSARIHQRIARSRKDHHYNTSHTLAKTGKRVFFVEDLALKNLTKRNKPLRDDKGNYLPNGQSSKSGLNKSFQDAGFGQFVDILTHIVAKTGGQVVKVKPNYTSQICCCCDNLVEKELSDRIHRCEKCSVVLDRDINAAINIKRVGLDVFPTIKRRKGKIVVQSCAPNSTLKEILELTRSLHRTD